MKRLLEKYWQGETSLEEEKRLQEFFLNGDVPEEWKKYRPLFVWKEKQKSVSIDKKVVTKPQKSIMVQFYPALKMAASVLIMLTVGIGFYTHYQQEKTMNKMFSDKAVNTENPAKDSKEVMAKASAVQLTPENMLSEELLDSMEMQTKVLKDTLQQEELN
ncbi:hypothetical protein AGMMS50262_07480 [Bacteroidia bacterium]|nr:hypothetical protein AGMMS50262_07480 [Bacteroidia bacterium]